MCNAMIIDGRDNVVVAIEPIQKGNPVFYLCHGKTFTFTAQEDVLIYHKVACKDIPKDSPVIKYGEHIGLAAVDVQRGQHVHVHNVKDKRENLDL